MLRSITFALSLILLFAISAAPLSAQTEPATNVSSPFDQEDPEIGAIRKLNWKNASFEKLDDENRCLAYMALNNGLARIGAKADSRLELLIDYLDEKELGTIYAVSKAEIPPPSKLTYDDMTRVAAAYVTSPQGVQRMSGEMSGITGDMLVRYTALYEKSSRRLFDEALDARQQVRSMGLFLEKQGKLDDFREWSIAAQKARADEQKKEIEEQQAKDAAARQERAQAYAEQKQQAQQAQQMEAALQMQQQSAGYDQSSGSSVDNDSYWSGSYGWPAYGYGYAYYSSNAYRGYVQDKYQNATDRWNNRPHPAPVSARPSGRAAGGARGGMRGGGRR